MPEDIPPAPDTTPGGLPLRVPQANLAPALRSDGPSSDTTEEEDVRSPEEVRRFVGAYQSGTRRGRNDAARTLGAPADDADGGPDPDPKGD